MLAHNEADLPIPPWSPENTGPLLVAAALVAAYRIRPGARAVAIALLTWGLLNAVGGGIVSVLPLPFLPFAPEQSVRHYLWHVVYTLGQVPLLLVALRALRSAGAADAEA
jgi:hypothetical protein